MKKGDIIEHYCCGVKVKGKVKDIKICHLTIDIVTEHAPIKWGRDQYTETFISIQKGGLKPKKYKGYPISEKYKEIV